MMRFPAADKTWDLKYFFVVVDNIKTLGIANKTRENSHWNNKKEPDPSHPAQTRPTG